MIGEVKRSLSHCTTKAMQEQQVQRIIDKYIQNQYPLDVILAAIKKGKNSLERGGRESSTEGIKWVKMPYIRGMYEDCKKVLETSNVRLVPTVTSTVGGSIQCARGGGDSRIMDLQGVVYAITCKDCTRIYVGQTGRKL